MSREPAERKVFPLADEPVVELDPVAPLSPPEEWYGLQTQIGRAGVSVPTNIVESWARRSAKDDL